MSAARSFLLNPLWDVSSVRVDSAGSCSRLALGWNWRISCTIPIFWHVIDFGCHTWGLMQCVHVRFTICNPFNAWVSWRDCNFLFVTFISRFSSVIIGRASLEGKQPAGFIVISCIPSRFKQGPARQHKARLVLVDHSHWVWLWTVFWLN